MVGCRPAVQPIKKNNDSMNTVKMSMIVGRPLIPFMRANPFFATVET